MAHLAQFGLQVSDTDEVLHEAMVVAADTLGLTEVALFEVAQGGGVRGRAALRDGRPVSRRGIGAVRLPAGRGSMAGFVLLERAAVTSEDLLGDERFVARAPDFDVPVRSAIAAPISWEAEPFGVLIAYDRELRRWTDDEVHFIQAIAGTMGLAIQRSRIEASLRDSTARLDLSLEAGGLGAWSWDIVHNTVMFNPVALAMYGVSDVAFDPNGDAFLALVHPEDRADLQTAVVEALAAGRDNHHHEFRIVRRDNGEVRWIESWGRRLGGDGAPVHLLGVCSDVTERRRAESQRESLLAREHAARVEAEQARERLAFLAEASAALSLSLEPEVTLETLADLCVPGLAEACFIDLLDESGLLAEQAARAITEAMLHDGKALRRRRTELGRDAPTSAGVEAAVSGQAVLHTGITDDLLQAAAADPDHLALLRRFDARSSVLAPLVTRGKVVGVLTLVRTGAAPPFDDDDLALIEELAGRAALAIDNGRLFHSRNRVARSLQAALLPPALPVVPGLDLAARYDVAEADVAIGGDFYDVIAVGPRTWAVAVGDVCGRGPDAAALTGLVRHTLRSAVVREHVPSRVLAQTNAAVIQQIDEAKFCTAAFVLIELCPPEQGGARVTSSSAGHPRPVLVRANGDAEVLAGLGTLLGVVEDPILLDTTVQLDPGDALVLYTDGVTEARRGADQFGEARLVETVRTFAGCTADEIAGGLEAEVASFRRSARDDTAILVIRAAPPA